MFSCVPVKKGYYYSYSYYHLDNYCISLTPGLWNLICFVKFRCMAGSVMPHPADWFLLFHRHKEVLDTCSGSLLQLGTFLIGAQLCPLVVKTSLYFTNWTELNSMSGHKQRIRVVDQCDNMKMLSAMIRVYFAVESHYPPAFTDVLHVTTHLMWKKSSVPNLNLKWSS